MPVLLCDFVPSDTVALALQVCASTRELMLEDIDMGFTAEIIDSGLTRVGTIKTEVDALDACVLLALETAFAQAGCPFPILPGVADPPDLTQCTEALAGVQAQTSAGPYDFLSSVMTITLDSSGKPIRITVP